MKKSDFPKIKKTLAFLLTFALLLSTAAAVMLVPASAAAVDVWDGTYADSYAGGTGTGSDPYLIATPEQLARMIGYDVLTNPTDKITNGSTGKYYKLTADIYLNDVSDANWYTKTGLNEWYSSTESRFCGNFDGNGYTIRGLHFASDATCTGLFPNIDAWAADRYFTNIKIADSYISGSSYAGAIVGYINSGNIKNVYFKNCYVDDTVIIVGGNNASGFIGAVAYDNSYYTVENSASLAVKPDGSKLQYGFIGNNHSWNWGCKYFSVTNSFAYADKYLGAAWGMGITNSHLISDLASIKGAAAKTAMPDLDWDNIWTVTADSYPVYLNLEGVKGEVWQGKVANGYAGGSGTETDPYIIETANQLAYMIKHDVMDTAANNASFSMGKYYKLAADIHLNDVSDPDWMKKTPNSWYATAMDQRFGGNLDGDGYTIYGLYYNGDSTVGLISYADLWSYDITVKNVIISDAYLKTTGQSVGTLIGYVHGNNNPGHTLTVSGCFANDNVLVQSTNSDGYVGGFVGSIRTWAAQNTLNFINCGSLADVKGDGTAEAWKHFAGLIGPIGNSANDSITVNIENCFAFPNLAIYSSGAGVEYTNSYALSDQASLLTILGDKAKETMSGFDWANGAFVPTKEGYPRLKRVSQRLGDINGDNKSNSEDIIILKKHFIGVEDSWVVDMNSDGEQDIRDLVNLKKKAASFTESKDGFVPDGYDLVWNDEFYGRTIDNEKWSTDQTRMHETTELGCFNDDSVRTVNNGGLAMTAYANPNPGDTNSYGGKDYITTNSITTENRMSFRYGYLEVKAKVPYKEGCWPSLWLRNNNATQVEGVTGLDGYNMEVDIIEPFGYTDRNATTIHETGTGDHHNQSGQNYAFQNPENLADEYHVYGFLWTKEKMKFYLDGEVVAIYDMATLDRSQWKSNFDDTVNILFNNHLFTASSEYIPDNDQNKTIEKHEGNLPAEFVVDYVRLYQNQDAGNALVLGK